MQTLRVFPQTMKLLAGCTLIATMLLSLGCAQTQTLQGMKPNKHPRYPALLVSEPDFVNHGKTGDIPLNLRVIKKSDSELWKDFANIAVNAKHWRIHVFKFSNESPVAGFDWVPINEDTRTLEGIPLDVTMRAYVDFCYDDDPDNPKEDQQSRSYLFMLHHYPENEGDGMMAPKKE